METKRPTVPAAEEILGLYHPVLDHGFVSLIDYMGSDESIERAARVSYGYGTRPQSQTRGLVRYLRRHLHTTPSEMVELKFHCAMPIFVARQWIRHRTACLAEGTEVYFDLPGDAQRRGARPYKLNIEDVWQRFRPARGEPDRERERQPAGDRLRRMRLRQLDEDTLRIGQTRLVDVYRNGPKPVFRMVLADGKRIAATADHRFLFANGWGTLRDSAGLEHRGGRAVWNRGEHYVRVNGREADVVRIERFEYVGLRETFDLEVEGPHHNFIANGIVTHNSVNEYSGRYSLMPLLFYRPEPEQVAAQSHSNRQGREAASVAGETYRRAIEGWQAAREAAAGAYEWLLGEDVARELARIDLPLSTYTQWYWKIDLHNLIHFLTLRVDPHAQWEIRQFAIVMAGMLKRVAPLSYEAWIDYQVCGARLSHGELEVLRRLLEVRDGKIASREDAGVLGTEEMAELGLSKREARELLDKLRPAERPDFELDVSRFRKPEEFEERMARAVPGDFD
jgi:thymidylate synthase (FAD)